MGDDELEIGKPVHHPSHDQSYDRNAKVHLKADHRKKPVILVGFLIPWCPRVDVDGQIVVGNTLIKGIEEFVIQTHAIYI